MSPNARLLGPGDVVPHLTAPNSKALINDTLKDRLR
jgi:hypothetical protein